MPPGGIHSVELLLLVLLLFVVVFAALAQKLKTPYPIVLVVAGLLLSFIPAIPEIRLNPEFMQLYKRIWSDLRDEVRQSYAAGNR